MALLHKHSKHLDLKPFHGRWDDVIVAHLLRRTMFGVAKADLEYFSKLSPKKAVHELVYSKHAEPQPPVNNYNDDKVTDDEIKPGETWVNATNKDGKLNRHRIGSLKAWWMGNMINQERSLAAKMTLFWHNHFSTEMKTVGNPLFAYRYTEVLRRNALGNFRNMVKEMTLSPAMLRYLNGSANTKEAPDENYGRELQELFTIGKGPGSHYTEDDVKAAAHVLTGFKIKQETNEYRFAQKQHDESDKQFSAFYDHRIIKGRYGKDGEEELDDLLDMIFSRAEVARFICRKLYVYFVQNNIDAHLEEQVIGPLADIFRKNRYDIQPVLATLLSSEHFFDPAYRGAIIKSPVELTVGLCREFSVKFPTNDNFVSQYLAWTAIHNQAANMQQNIGDPPNVAGWPAYYESPQYYKLWINSDTLPKRRQFTDKMINKGFEKDGKRLIINPIAFTSQLKNPGDPDAFIDEVCTLLLPVSLSDEQKELIKTSILLSNLEAGMSDHYWTNAWKACQQEPNDEDNKVRVTNKLKALYQYLMGLPEYQLC